MAGGQRHRRVCIGRGRGNEYPPLSWLVIGCACARGFFVTTEDGSNSQNRVLSAGESGKQPTLDYDLARIPASLAEHRAVTKAFKKRLLRNGPVSVSRVMGLVGAAHALGSLVTGNDPEKSVVDANGKIHGIDNLYVADGSVLPRASRVNPALAIYVWGCDTRLHH